MEFILDGFSEKLVPPEGKRREEHPHALDVEGSVGEGDFLRQPAPRLASADFERRDDDHPPVVVHDGRMGEHRAAFLVDRRDAETASKSSLSA